MKRVFGIGTSPNTAYIAQNGCDVAWRPGGAVRSQKLTLQWLGPRFLIHRKYATTMPIQRQLCERRRCAAGPFLALPAALRAVLQRFLFFLKTRSDPHRRPRRASGASERPPRPSAPQATRSLALFQRRRTRGGPGDPPRSKPGPGPLLGGCVSSVTSMY